MLHAVEMDAARRGNYSPHYGPTTNNDRRAVAASAASAAAVTPGKRGEGAGGGSNEENTDSAGHIIGSSGIKVPGAAVNGVNCQSTHLCSNGEEGIEADTDTSEHLGVIDVSKVSSTRKSERPTRCSLKLMARRRSWLLLLYLY